MERNRAASGLPGLWEWSLSDGKKKGLCMTLAEQLDGVRRGKELGEQEVTRKGRQLFAVTLLLTI